LDLRPRIDGAVVRREQFDGAVVRREQEPCSQSPIPRHSQPWRTRRTGEQPRLTQPSRPPGQRGRWTACCPRDKCDSRAAGSPGAAVRPVRLLAPEAQFAAARARSRRDPTRYRPVINADLCEGNPVNEGYRRSNPSPRMKLSLRLSVGMSLRVWSLILGFRPVIGPPIAIRSPAPSRVERKLPKKYSR